MHATTLTNMFTFDILWEMEREDSRNRPWHPLTTNQPLSTCIIDFVSNFISEKNKHCQQCILGKVIFHVLPLREQHRKNISLNWLELKKARCNFINMFPKIWLLLMLWYIDLETFHLLPDLERTQPFYQMFFFYQTGRISSASKPMPPGTPPALTSVCFLESWQWLHEPLMHDQHQRECVHTLWSVTLLTHFTRFIQRAADLMGLTQIVKPQLSSGETQVMQ